MSDKASVTIEESSGGEVPAWMLTYADTVTLLMTFFVMLMGFSTFDTGSFAKVRGSLVGHLGIAGEDKLAKDSLLDRRNMDASRIHVSGYENPPTYDPLSYVEESFELLVKEAKLANIVQYRLTEMGFEIHILPGTLFPLGSAELKDGAERLLKLIGRACEHTPHNLRVMGHSDLFYVEEYSRPEELALDRAATVCALLQEGGVAAERIAVAAKVHGGDSLPARWPAGGAAGGNISQVQIVVMRPARLAAVGQARERMR